MRFSENLNLPILQDGDKYSKEIQNEAFNTIDKECTNIKNTIKSVLDINDDVTDAIKTLGDISEELSDLKEKQNEDYYELLESNNYIGEKISDIDSQLETIENEFSSKIEINVRDFGAVGDGEDYTVELQKALDYVNENGGGTVKIPRGIYKISEVLNQYSNTSIIGEGINNTIIQTTNIMKHAIWSYPRSVHVKNLSVQNLTIIGCGNDSMPPDSNRTGQYGDSGISIKYTMAENVLIKNVKVSWFVAFGMSFTDCKNIKIVNNFLNNIGRDGIDATGSKNVIISGNHINYCGDDSIAIHKFTGHTTLNENGGENIVITNNIIEHGGAIASFGTSDVIISNNIIRYNRGGGISVGGAHNFTKEDLSVSHNIIVCNNIIEDSFKIYGQQAILLNRVSDSYTGQTLSNNVKIVNNIIRTRNIEPINTDWQGNQLHTPVNRLEYGIEIRGVTRKIDITQNIFNTINWCIYNYRLKNSFLINYNISNNTFDDCSNGIVFTKCYNKKCSNIISGNSFDLDRNKKSGKRNEDGSWQEIDGYYAIYLTEQEFSTRIFDNDFDNCYMCYNGSSAPIFERNYMTIPNCKYDYNWGYGKFCSSAIKVYVGANGEWVHTQETHSTAIPTKGIYKKGDIIYNKEPGVGRPIGWICITEGSPGAWKPFGVITD